MMRSTSLFSQILSLSDRGSFTGLVRKHKAERYSKGFTCWDQFVPMFMFLGYSHELTQIVYRIGDSITNIISPMMSFFALIIAFIQKYDHRAGIGTIIATMLPYTIAFFIAWTILLIAWILIGLPLGPGAGLYYEMPG